MFKQLHRGSQVLGMGIKNSEILKVPTPPPPTPGNLQLTVREGAKRRRISAARSLLRGEASRVCQRRCYPR